MEPDYPTIARRYMATFIDGVLVLSLFLIGPHLFKGETGLSSWMRILFIAGGFFLYEPFFTSKFCTLGQKIMGIRIRTAEGLKKISLFAAFRREIVKLFLGIISFFTIPFTKGRRAIHDFAAGSVVIVK